jgi:plasmid stabilization system protein ParE
MNPIELRFAPDAQRDLTRLHRFLARSNARAAARAIVRLLDAAESLRFHPLLGADTGEGLRELVVAFGSAAYIIRYRADPGVAAVVARIWHAREARED